MIAVLFSGGKDSVLTSFVMQSKGYEVSLVSFFPENKESFMLHSVCVEITGLLAKAMDVKHYVFEVSGRKEEEVEEMKEGLRKIKAKGIASGAISSEYQKQRIDYIGEELGIPTYAPLWHKKLKQDYREMEIILSSVSAMGLSKEDLGKNAIEYMEEYNYFEGGDAETLVLDAPFFKKRVRVEFEKIWEGTGGYIKIVNAWLEGKDD